jgi:hypothetical protein
MRAYPSHKRNYRAPRTDGMKTFVEGTAIKFTIVLDTASATTCTIEIQDPSYNLMVDQEGMTQEADYVYAYVYQTAATHFGEGDWIVTFRATANSLTALTQDNFSLTDCGRVVT